MTVTVVSGGVGAARFLAGLVQVVPPADVTAVVNVGDDVELHGLHVSPDLDTITYTLAGAIDPERGWGLAHESWTALEALRRYDPTGTWFNLGDRDLATHLYRTRRLAEGAALSDVTGEIARAWGLGLHILPVTDDRLRTMLTLASTAPVEPRDAAELQRSSSDDDTRSAKPAPTTPVESAQVSTVESAQVSTEISFQEYFVKLRHSVPVSAVRFDGAEAAKPAPGVIEAIESAERVVVAPSNPIVSIDPVLAVPGVREALVVARERTVAVSPIVAGAALKGPADRLLAELGHEVSVAGVARICAPFASVLVIDEADAALAPAVEAEGVACIVAPTIMSGPAEAAALARTCLEAFEGVVS